jgi:hypothetical protein
MRQINGVCPQAFNRRHGLVGRLFQGRDRSNGQRARANPENRVISRVFSGSCDRIGIGKADARCGFG